MPQLLSPVFVAGPTAVGKSALALALAGRVQGEIVSVDSMQVYRGLDIGTAKPSLAERARIAHHLIDILDLDQTFDAAQFVLRAKEAVEAIQGRGQRPIFCGGTGLYFQVYLGGLGTVPPGDAALRAELEAQPLANLLQELSQRDPALFQTIDRRNPRRVVRAIEVIRLTGQPFSALRASWPEESSAPFCILMRPAGLLRRRIDERVDAMFQAGLVEETQKLLDRGLQQNRTASQALGYRQVVEYLKGERSLPETINLVKIRTWQFARRQLTWFKKRRGTRWIHLTEDEVKNLEIVLEEVSRQ